MTIDEFMRDIAPKMRPEYAAFKNSETFNDLGIISMARLELMFGEDNSHEQN